MPAHILKGLVNAIAHNSTITHSIIMLSWEALYLSQQRLLAFVMSLCTVNRLRTLIDSIC